MPDLNTVRDQLLKRQAELRNRTERANADLRHKTDPLAADFADQAVQRDLPHEAVRLLAASEIVGDGPDLSRPDGSRVESAVRAALGTDMFEVAMRRAREDFAGVQPSELATTEAVRELGATVLGLS